MNAPHALPLRTSYYMHALTYIGSLTNSYHNNIIRVYYNRAHPRQDFR